MKLDLDFRPVSEDPTEEGDYVIYNQCDGYHIVESHFEDGEFVDFYFWPFKPVGKDFYRAWAKLPEASALYGEFSRDAVSAK